MKQKSVYAIVALGYLAIIFAIWRLLYTPVIAIQSTWELEQTKYMKNSNLLVKLTEEMGYGGFIHSFKNYVIRREPPLLKRSMNSIQEVSNILISLDESLLEKNERQHLMNLYNTVDEYKNHVEWLRTNNDLATSLSTAELDQKVRVDDTQALFALQYIVESHRAIFKNVRYQTINMQESYIRQLVMWFVIISVVYWLVAIVCYFYYRSFVRSHQHMGMINELSPSALVLTNETGEILEVNPAFLSMFGISKGLNIKGSNIDIFVPDSARDKHKKLRDDFHNSERTVAMNERTGEIYAKRLDGQNFPVQVAISSRRSQGVNIALAVVNDLSNEKQLKEEARLDYLTKIHNRRYCEEVLEKEFYRAERYGGSLTVMLVDIDKFKEVNDSLGHQAGDDVIINVVDIIQSHIRQSDTLCRWGGDEFLCILPNTAIENAEKLADKLVVSVHDYYCSQRIKTTLSIGLAKAFQGQSIADVISNVDEALYTAKSQGRNRFSVYQGKE
jgi:diguanylate cyclase (GGDEF)-like protein/PAS domain S-box-containing protein